MKAVLRSICFALAGLPFIACGTPPDPPEPRAAWSAPADKAVEPVLIRSVGRSDSDGTELIVGNVARRLATGLSQNSARDFEPAARPFRCGGNRCPGGAIETVGND